MRNSIRLALAASIYGFSWAFFVVSSAAAAVNPYIPCQDVRPRSECWGAICSGGGANACTKQEPGSWAYSLYWSFHDMYVTPGGTKYLFYPGGRFAGAQGRTLDPNTWDWKLAPTTEGTWCSNADGNPLQRVSPPTTDLQAIYGPVIQQGARYCPSGFAKYDSSHQDCYDAIRRYFSCLANPPGDGGGGGPPPEVPLPPEIATYAATGVTQTTATLNGGVNPNGAATTVWFEYNASGGQAQTVGTASVGSGTDVKPVFFPLSGLQSGTSYFYRVVAKNSAGTVPGAALTFTTRSTPLPPPSPSPGNPPLAMTSPATSIGSTSAVLNGLVNPNGENASAWFEYGRTNLLGQSSRSTPVGSGTAPTEVRVDFSDADEGAVYYYRVVAENRFGVSRGSVLSFKTAAGGGTLGGGSGGAAPLARTTIATNVSRTSAVFNGFVNPNRAHAQAWFEYGTTKLLGQISDVKAVGGSAVPVGVTVAVFDLQPDTTYYYRLVARNAYGVTRGAILSTNFTGSPSFAISPSHRTVSTGGIAGFTVSYDPDGSGPLLAKDVTAGATWNASDPGIASHEGNGAFRGRGAGEAIVTAFYNNQSATFRLDDINNLTAQGLLTVNRAGNASLVRTGAATDVESRSAMLHGSVNATNLETDVWFEYGSSEFLDRVAGNQRIGGGDVPTDMAATVSDLAPNTTYYYRFVAQNTLGPLYGEVMLFTTPADQVWTVRRALTLVVLMVIILGGAVFLRTRII